MIKFEKFAREIAKIGELAFIESLAKREQDLEVKGYWKKQKYRGWGKKSVDQRAGFLAIAKWVLKKRPGCVKQAGDCLILGRRALEGEIV